MAFLKLMGIGLSLCCPLVDLVEVNPEKVPNSTANLNKRLLILVWSNLNKTGGKLTIPVAGLSVPSLTSIPILLRRCWCSNDWVSLVKLKFEITVQFVVSRTSNIPVLPYVD